MSTTKTPLSKTRRTQTVERAALVLTCFTNEEPLLGLPDLANRLGLDQSTLYRYISALRGAALLERDERRGGYRLGLRIIELAGVALNQSELRKHAVDEMDRLRDTFSLLVNLGVLFEGDVMHLAVSAPAGWPRWFTTVGRRAVAHCTAQGKVLLAYRPWEEVRRTVERYGWRPCTDNSIRTFDRLQTELEKIRNQGFAVDEQERRVGSTCIGVPIRDYTGDVVAALSISGTLTTLSPERYHEVLPALQSAASRISLHLGHHGSSVIF